MTYGDLIVLILAIVVTVFCVGCFIYIVKNQVFEQYGFICIVMPVFMWICALTYMDVVDVDDIVAFMNKPI